MVEFDFVVSVMCHISPRDGCCFALHSGNNAVVLGAFGCGYFGASAVKPT